MSRNDDPETGRALRDLLVVVLPLSLVFVLSLPAVTSRIYASDEVLYFAYLRSLWFDHDISFDNEYRHLYDSGAVRTELFRETFIEPTSATGHRINFATIGCAILWSPFYVATDVGVRIARMSGSSVRADGYSRPYVSAVCFASAIYGLLSLLLSLAVARRVVPGFANEHLQQLVTAVAIWIGTPLVFYMYVAPPYSHACSAAVVAAFVLVWLRVRERWAPAGLIALGALAALMTMVREQDSFYAAGPALDFLWTFSTRIRGGDRQASVGILRRTLLGVCAAAVAFAVAFTPQAAVYLTLNGHLHPSPLLTRKITLTSPHAGQVLFSPEHGFLFWTPIAAMSIAGLILLAVRPVLRAEPSRLDPATAALKAAVVRRIAICLIVMTAAGVYIIGSVESWTLAGAFGQRRFVDLTVVLVVGLAAIVARARGAAPRASLVAGLVLGIWWNVALMAQFGSGLMDRQRLEIGRNAWTAFVVLPRELPGLVYRYVFDRPSFYMSQAH